MYAHMNKIETNMNVMRFITTDELEFKISRRVNARDHYSTRTTPTTTSSTSMNQQSTTASMPPSQPTKGARRGAVLS